MNHREILKKWIGKRVFETPKLGYQCVAWAKKYCEEKGTPIGNFSGSAEKWWNSWSPFTKNWKRVYSNGFNSPSEWDIIFWSSRRCKDWHVAIANKFCFPFLFRYTDQNGTWKEDEIQPRFEMPKNVVGWYHYMG